MKRISLLDQYRGICNDILGKMTTKVLNIPDGDTHFIWAHPLEGSTSFSWAGMANRVNNASARTFRRILTGAGLTCPFPKGY